MMDKKMTTAAERQAENKRRFEEPSRNTQNQQQPFKRNNVARAYTAGPGDKKPYGGTKPLCTKCNYHHDGPCTLKCSNCKKTGHSARDCKARPTANYNNNNNNNNNQRSQGTNPRVITCFECGVQGHYKSDCPKLKNGNQGNRAGNGNAVARAYVVGSAGTNPNSNVVTDHGCDVELADGRIIWVNTLIRGCTLNFLNHPFNIDLMPVEIGSFDVIIGMDWLAKYHAVIVCDEKLVRIPFGNKTLIFHGDGSNNGHESRLNIISCTKAQRYLLEGCPIFLAQVTMKEAEDKSKEKQLEEGCANHTWNKFVIVFIAISDLLKDKQNMIENLQVNPVRVINGGSCQDFESVKDWESPKSATTEDPVTSEGSEDFIDYCVAFNQRNGRSANAKRTKAPVVFALRSGGLSVRDKVKSKCSGERLSRKGNEVKPLRVRALVMYYWFGLPMRILEAQNEARGKP
ncbi:putative reverse transcriptase domain-containing protein [Tanacetum coccineum]